LSTISELFTLDLAPVAKIEYTLNMSFSLKEITMKLFYRFRTAFLSLAVLTSFCFHPINADAAKKKSLTAAEIAAAEQVEAERQASYDKTVDSNLIENWPQGPQIYADAAIVMEASTGAILYNKDMDMQNFPASITKIMTALLAVENCSMDEVITYSYEATHSIEAGSSSIYTQEGEELTVEQSLYGLLLASANECGNGIAEHIAGSNEAFAEMMNERAAELGCTNTHFVNPHGLHDDNHYTSPHDMALIMQAALQNENFVRIAGTAKYELGPTNMDDEISYMTNHHYMIGAYKGVTKYLDDTVIAGKTGYTSNAQGTLVTAAERNGMTLIVVTMHTRSTSETGVPLFSDTALLLDYASENFTKWNVSSNETSFSVDNEASFHTGSAIFGSSQPLIEIDKNDSIILPNGVSFTDASPVLSFEDSGDSDILATLSYTYQDQSVGSASIRLADTALQEFTFDKETGEEDEAAADTQITPKRFIRINVRLILTFLVLIAVLFLLYRLIRQLIKNFQFSLNLSKYKQRFITRRRQRANIRFQKKKASRGRYHRKPKKRSTSSYDELDL
jgi:D-alanyl-D-alanine carboxypeptidase (penicillin-binding protein 5/6)